MSVKVDVEYCGVCNFKSQCEELSQVVKAICPEADVQCKTGRRGAFEVQINDTLVHSKLACLAFPDFKDVGKNAQLAMDGEPFSMKVKEQPITDCTIQ